MPILSAFDGTDRERDVPMKALLAHMHCLSKLAMTLLFSRKRVSSDCEGRYNTPLMAVRGIKAGAWAIVGSALARLEHVSIGSLRQ